MERKYRADATLGLLQNISPLILSKLNVSDKFINLSTRELEVVIISGDTVDNLVKFVDNFGGKYEELGYGFGIVTLSVDKVLLLAQNDKIQYIELPKSLYTTDLKSNKATCIQTVRNVFGLKGKGVLVGFIDSGIDYTHPAFRNDDGTTRIEYIYDLSEDRKVYNKDMINTALKATDPYSVVSSFDSNEHGTHVAGIACAGGKIDQDNYGVAPMSSIAMVKCTRGKYALSTNIMRGLKFLIGKSKELNMPLSINLSLSTNDGAHDGMSLLEQYISTMAILERITISIAAGNEGEAAHHVGGELKGESKISLNVASDESAIVINLYKSILPDIEIKLVNSTGASTDYISTKEGYNYGRIGRDKYQIFSTGPKPFDVHGEIIISINTNSKYLASGQWDINIKVINEYSGKFDMWLPILEGLNQNTKFLQPSVLNTLGIPATASNVIAVGSYNYLTNTISSFSGRGNQMLEGNIRPDVVAPGEDIVSVVPNNGVDTKSGTSMAAPHVAGIGALLMEWGIVKGNDPYLYGDRIKYFLIISAKRPRADIVYPDPSWGYGEVCALAALEEIIDVLGTSSSIKDAVEEKDRNLNCLKEGDYNEYMVGNLYIRKPSDI